MQLIVILGVIAKLALVSGECDVGKTVNDFDFTKFTGTWYYLFYQPNEDDDKIKCPIDHYDDPVGNVSKLRTYEYSKREREEVVIRGHALNWDNTGYSIKFDTDIYWNGRMYIAAVDYDSYFIGKFCSEELNKLIIYIAFRSSHPDEATQEEADKALISTDIVGDDLKYWDAKHCAKLPVE